jgi:hypothetical protein
MHIHAIAKDLRLAWLQVRLCAKAPGDARPAVGAGPHRYQSGFQGKTPVPQRLINFCNLSPPIP